MILVRVFFTCIIAASLIVSASAQIPNGGFENWTSGEPDGWVSSNINGIVTNVTQSAVAHSGSSAVRGNVVSFFTSGLAPVIQIGPRARGFAYNQRPVSATGYYQFFPQGGDRFGVNIALFHGGSDGTLVANAALAISQGASSYVQFDAPFVYQTNDTPDTCILQFQIVGPVTGTDFHVGSYFLLDDLAFTNSSDVTRREGSEPTAFQLSQNYPNPFNPTTTVEFSLPNSSLATLKIFDLLGREVATLVNEHLTAGSYKTEWDAGNMPSGTYVYSLRAGNFVQTKKLLLLR